MEKNQRSPRPHPFGPDLSHWEGYAIPESLKKALIEEDAKTNVIAKKIEELRQALSTAEMERTVLKKTAEIEQERLKDTIRTLIDEKNDAQERAVYHMKSAEEAKTALQLIKSQHAEEMKKLRDQLESVRREQNMLHNQLQEAQSSEKTIKTMLELKDEQERTKVTELEQEIVFLKEQCELQTKSISTLKEQEVQLINELKEANNELARFKTAEFDSKLMSEFDEQWKRQSSMINSLQEEKGKLEVELNQYKNHFRDMEERIRAKQNLDLQRKIREVEDLRQNMTRLEADKKRLEYEREEWAKYMKSEIGDRYVSPADLVDQLTQERKMAREQAAEQQERAESLDRQLKLKEDIIRDHEHQIRKLQERISQLENIQKEEKYNQLMLKKERDLLLEEKNVLEEQLLDICQIQEAVATQKEEQDEQNSLTESLSKLRGLLKEWQGKVLKLEKELHEARSREPSSEAARPKERILELKANPFSTERELRAKLIRDLQAEVQELRRQLLLAEDTTVTESDSKKRKRGEVEQKDESEEEGQGVLIKIPRITFENLNEEIKRLKETVAKKEKRNMRLLQVWNEKVDEINHTIRNLFGYSLEFTEEATYVHSTYIDKSKLSFVFKKDEQGALRVMGTEKEKYMQIFDGDYETFFKQRNSIPGFLSTVTLELMND